MTHEHQSLDRMVMQIRVRDRMISALSSLAIILAVIIVILAAMLVLTTRANAAPQCMSKAEARAQWPRSHLYWHGPSHCWDRTAGGSRYRNVRFSHAEEIKPKKPTDGNGNHPIIMPPLNKKNDAPEPEFFTARPATMWPLIIDIDGDVPNPDMGIDGCCWPRLEDLFKDKWNSMPQNWQK